MTSFQDVVYSNRKNHENIHEINRQIISLENTIGHNGFTYKVDKSWSKQNVNIHPVHHCHEMVMDKKGRLFMTTTHKKNNVLVFPTGMISTSIFIYLLFKWSLLGDMIINAYYFIMSVYGWYIWTRKENNIVTPISKVNFREKITCFVIFSCSLIFLLLSSIFVANDSLLV